MSEAITALLEAVSHQQHGRLSEAETIYRDVIRGDPRQPNALYLYGLLQLKSGRAADAATLLDRAAQLRPDVEVRLHLARAYLAANQNEAALAAAEAALAQGGCRSEALFLHGTALNACGRPVEAIVSLSEAALGAPKHAATWLNMGNAHMDLDKFDEGEAHIRAAVSLDPALVEAHISLGFVLASRGQLNAAIAAYEHALMLAPESGEAHWNLATALLLAGDFERGFQEYEWRKRHQNFRRYFRQLPGPVWTGFHLADTTILVHAEQGLGDTIQLTRYATQLAAKGARVVLACSKPLVALLRTHADVAEVVPRDGPLPPYDCWVDQMSLPRLLGTTPDDIPGASGYLTAAPDRQSAWAARLGDARIGIVWAGNPLHSNDVRRSLTLETLRRLAIPGMVSLQVGPRAHEAEQLGLLDPSPDLADYAETAALVANLDLVITVDTSVAHLAGALGVPVWIMLPYAPDWRWMIDRRDSPWYRSARLFRQSEPGNWIGVVDQVRAELASLNC